MFFLRCLSIVERAVVHRNLGSSCICLPGLRVVFRFRSTVSPLILTSEVKRRNRSGPGLNPGENIDVCKCIVPAQHGGTLNIRRPASSLVRLVEGEERWEASDHPQSVLPLNWGGTKPNRTVTCMVLEATANDRRHLALCHDEFCGPRSGLCRSGGIGNNNNIIKLYAKIYS
ncbi:uncharacterized protein TNCV_3747301 [Trichonephila clavipes]|nr:uncharacterized protein TNCV_3747301 [Trichonephila clavipes]